MMYRGRDGGGTRCGHVVIGVEGGRGGYQGEWKVEERRKTKKEGSGRTKLRMFRRARDLIIVLRGITVVSFSSDLKRLLSRLTWKFQSN